MKTKNIFLFILAAFLGSIILLKIFSLKPPVLPQATGKRLPEKITVRAAPLKKETLEFTLSYVGTMKAKDEINVFSKAGGKLIEYKVNDGDRIEKGSVVALIDRDETGLKYEPLTVEAPISGILGRTLLDKGENIIASSGANSGTAVAVIVNMEEMLIKVDAIEQDIPYLKIGLNAKAQVDAYPDEVFSGEVSKVSQVLDPQTRTLPVEITIPNKDYRLKSGMFCRIKIFALKRQSVLVLGQDAIVQEFGSDYAFVAEDGLARKKKIKLGIQEDNRIEILEGLNEGEQMIVFGQEGLKDGTPIEISTE